MTVQRQERDHFLVRELVEFGALDHSIEYQHDTVRFPVEKRLYACQINIILFKLSKIRGDTLQGESLMNISNCYYVVVAGVVFSTNTVFYECMLHVLYNKL